MRLKVQAQTQRRLAKQGRGQGRMADSNQGRKSGRNLRMYAGGWGRRKALVQGESATREPEREQRRRSLCPLSSRRRQRVLRGGRTLGFWFSTAASSAAQGRGRKGGSEGEMLERERLHSRERERERERERADGRQKSVGMKRRRALPLLTEEQRFWQRAREIEREREKGEREGGRDSARERSREKGRERERGKKEGGCMYRL